MSPDAIVAALLAQVSAVLGTTTKNQTVNLALSHVLEQVRRGEDLIAAVTGQVTRWVVPRGTVP